MSEDKLASMNLSLSSGLHRYAGDSDLLKLRLLFTDHALLASSPRFRLSKQAHQNSNLHKPPTTSGRQASSVPTTITRPTSCDRTPQIDKLSSFHSSYLIQKRFGRWTIRPEVKSCPLKNGGLRLLVTSTKCDGGCASTSEKSGNGGGREAVSGERTTNTNFEHNNNDNNILEELTTKNECAFNWKDTVVVTSDKNEWQRSMARKLPSEMRNHCNHYHLATRNFTHFDSCCLSMGRFDICSHRSSGNSDDLGLDKDDGSKIVEDGNGYTLFTNWYRQQSLGKGSSVETLPTCANYSTERAANDNVQSPATGVMISADRTSGASGSRGMREEYNSSSKSDDTRLASSSLFDNAKIGDEPVEAVGLAAQITGLTNLVPDKRSMLTQGIVLDSTNHSRHSSRAPIAGEDEIKKQWLSADIRPSTIGCCSHVEILYITMEKHETNDSVAAKCGESFALLTQAKAAAATTTDRDNTSRDATVSTQNSSTDNRDIDGNASDSKVHELHHESLNGGDRVNSQLSSDEQNRYQKDKEHDGDQTAKQRHIEAYDDSDNDAKLNSKATRTATVNACEDDHCESSDRDETLEDEREVNLANDRQDRRMLKERLKRHSNSTANNGSRLEFCRLLAVVVIDKLNRSIQLKPDLHKLTSVDICTELAGFCGASATSATTSTSSNNHRVEHQKQTEAAARGGFSKVSMTPAQIPCCLLYQLELVAVCGVGGVSSGGGSSSTAAHETATESNADSQLNVLYKHLFWKPYEHSERGKTGQGFFNPVNGSILIKLQFDIHFASDFSKDCRNLYVKYKLLARLGGESSQWKLRRLGGGSPARSSRGAAGRRQMKEEEMPRDEKQRKSAQMSHSITTLNDTSQSSETSESRQQTVSTIPLANASAGGDEPEKPSAKSIVLAASLGQATVAAKTLVDTVLDAKQQQRPATIDGGPDTTMMCLLEGSTITSEPDSRGRFHFACVEELVLELAPAWSDNNNGKNKRPTTLATQSHPLSSRSLSTLSERQQAASMLQQQQQQQPLNTSFESIPQIGKFHDDRAGSNDLQTNLQEVLANNLEVAAPDSDRFVNHQLAGEVAKQPMANGNNLIIDKSRATHSAVAGGANSSSGVSQDSKSSPPSLSLARNGNDNQVIIINNETDINQVSGYNQQIPGNKSQITTANEVPNDASCPQQNLDNAYSNDCSTTTTMLRAIDRDGGLEIMLLFEFYSNDFYRDKLQGWSHLTIPIDLDSDRRQSRNDAAKRMEPQSSGLASNRMTRRRFARTTPLELLVIRPELCSLVDKLRYYLIGQLPASLPPIENFARSNHRYMLLTKQSGKLVLDFEVVSQFSDPNFDTAFRDLLEIGKEHGKRNQYNGVDLDYVRNLGVVNTSTTAESADSDCSNTEQDYLDTRGVVEAYKRAKDRIDRLNLITLLTN